MHILGLQGMSRRIYTYTEGQGFNLWNMVATIGAFILAVSHPDLHVERGRTATGRTAKNPVNPGPTRGTPARSSG